jgi:hypothetical protein
MNTTTFSFSPNFTVFCGILPPHDRLTSHRSTPSCRSAFVELRRSQDAWFMCCFRTKSQEDCQ